MTAQPTDGPEITSIESVLDRWGGEFSVTTGAMAVLRERLVDREDNIKDVLNLAGAQFGLFPQIVAEVLAQVGLGTAPTEEERTMIRANFNLLMEEIARAQQEGGQ